MFSPDRIRRVLSSPPAPPPVSPRFQLGVYRSSYLPQAKDDSSPDSQRSNRERCQGRPFRRESSLFWLIRSGHGGGHGFEACGGVFCPCRPMIDQVDATAGREVVWTRSSDQGHLRQSSKRARSDDGDARSRAGGPTSTNGSGGKPPFYWQYESSKRFPI
ncbi:unnamed protein product [Microthlaspi erraticum]|uniref:Uncharacterized protein n=1 Tax=Microthlaspi erraticum TaxID=1685480 RepID=A0A6D2JLA0_9BRAS|nr:unnamed protein product [Microthlaspi erraticum]